MTEEKKKLEIEDIKDPEEEIDLEDALSEEEKTIEEPEEKDVSKPQNTEIPEKSDDGPVITETAEVKKPKISSKSSRKKTIILFSVIALVATTLVLGGAYWYLSATPAKDSKEEDQTEEKNEEKTESQTPAETVAEEFVYVTEPTGLNLREEPNPSGKLIMVLKYGTKLKKLQEQNGWLKVQSGEKTGWCSKEYTASDNPLVYTNTKYGFEITFPETWSAYKVFEGGPTEVALFYFALPTTDKTWKDSNTDGGYASLMAVTIYSKDQYDAAKSEGGSIGEPTATKGNYVYLVSSAQATPGDLEARFEEVSQIKATFKAL